MGSDEERCLIIVNAAGDMWYVMRYVTSPSWLIFSWELSEQTLERMKINMVVANVEIKIN